MRVSVADVVRSPGMTRHFSAVVARPELDAADGAWGPADEALVSSLHVDLTFEMLVEGLLARGTVSFTTSLQCARCVNDVSTVNSVPIAELFVDPHRVPEGEELEVGYELYPEGVIDIEALLRDAVLAVLPLRVLCDAACRGLCPACGTDLNVEDCGHEPARVPDPRWAVLQGLRLPPG